MHKKVFGVLILFSYGIFALPAVPTVLNNVQVKIFSGSGTNYSGRVTYFYSAGDNDSLNISLKIDPAPANSGAPACTIIKAEGDVGIFPVVNCMNGRREIFFDCSFPSFPGSNLYTATVTILTDQSNLEKTARAILAGIPNPQKCNLIAGNGCFGTRDAIGVVAPSPYTTIAGFHMSEGPSGVNFRDPYHVSCATLFPREAAAANAFDTGLAYRLGRAIGEECKPSAQFCGLGYNTKSQNINLAPMLTIVRDPRYGRAFETWGEDPFLIAKLATSDVRGRQSEGIICTPRNFVCNDQELFRETSSSDVDDTTLRQTYCYPFEMCLREAKPWGLIAAYNKLNGTYCTDDTTLLTGIAKQEWGFRGFIMSDWFTWMTNPAIYSGLDVEMDENRVFGKICDGSVPQDIVDAKVLAQLRGKIWTGCVNDFSAFDALPLTYNSPDHVALADEGAHKSIVLVKNDSIMVGGVKQAPLLPLNKNTINTVAVVGPYANLMRTGPECDGTSDGFMNPCTTYTPLKAIQDKIGASKVVTDWTSATIVIVFVGVPSIGTNSPCEGHDRPDVVLPVSEDGTDQNALVQSMLAAGKKTIVVLTGGSAVSQGAWSNASSIIVAFYPGQRQGAAIADVLFGDYNPSGRLSVTFPKAATDLPPFTAEGAATRIYQYERPNEGRGYPYYIFSNKVNRILFPFGMGLSYTEFTYSNLAVPSVAPIGSKIRVKVDVTNSGAMAGDHIVQLYMKQVSGLGALSRPALQLRGFARVTLAPGATKTVSFDLKEWDFAHWSKAEGWIVDPESTYELSIRHYSTETPPAGMTQTIAMY